MPTPRDQATAGVIDGILYVAGGMKLSGALDTVEAFDPKTNQWTTKASMPTPRFQHGAAVVSGSLFVFGGVNGLALVPTVAVYDPATNSWTTLSSPLLTVRKQLMVVPINTAVFAMGGDLDLEGKFGGVNEQFIPPSCLTNAANGNSASR